MQQLQIASYNPQWVTEFEAERERIAHVIGDVPIRIEHNGSTAVPGLAAKPVIDTQVSVLRRSRAARSRLQESHDLPALLERQLRP